VPSIEDYRAEFKHTDWVDYVSLVQAEGGDGFNSRFHDLEKEFTALEKVIKSVRAAFAQPTIITLAPTLTSFSAKDVWIHELGGALKPPGVTSITGIMPVILPQGYRVRSLRATGNKAGGTLSVQLFRHALTGGSVGQSIVAVTPVVNGAFNETQIVLDEGAAQIDNNTFRYYVAVFLNGAGENDQVQLRAFQIVCNAV
jgi:hypothetical protein